MLQAFLGGLAGVAAAVEEKAAGEIAVGLFDDWGENFVEIGDAAAAAYRHHIDGVAVLGQG